MVLAEDEQREGWSTDGREATPVEKGRASFEKNGHHLLHADREQQQQLAQQAGRASFEKGRASFEKGRVSFEHNGHHLLHGDRELQQQAAEKGRLSFTNSPRISISFKNPSGSPNSKADNFDVVLDIQSPLRGAAEKRRNSDATGFKGPLPITLKFEDVEYSVTVKPQSSWFEFKDFSYKSLIPKVPKMFSKKSNRGTDKQILHGMSGVVKPGEILAMLGPSGSGKTTLLNVLGGRAKGHLTGKILYNDLTYTKGMKRRTGFVTQDDVLLPHLTVQETLVYAAYLRLSSKEFTKRQKVQRAEDVIAELGLEKCKDTFIGGPFLRGISGGERKRVSIGHEMLIDPSLLLLDEPTSGLDSTIALKIIHTLQDLARGGRTIVTTIHQPSSIIFHTFTKLLLLSEGYVLYYGLGSEAMNYFGSQGFKPAFQTNPADFLLDLANGIMYDSTDANNEEFESEAAMKDTRHKKDEGSKEVLLSTLREAYNKNLLTRARYSISQSAALTEEEFKASQEKREWPTTWLDQCNILTNRSIKERRHDVFAGLRIVQVAIMSIITGLLWWQSTPDKIQDQVGLLFYITTFWGFFPLFLAMFTFPQERQMLMKERASGMYRLSAYFCARTMADLPLELVLPTFSVTLIYWMGGLKATAGAFFACYFVVILNVLVSQGLGLLLGAAFMDIKQATTLSSVLLLTFQLAGGYFVQKTPIWIGWIKYVSFMYYNYKLQLWTQYNHKQTYPCEIGRCRIVDYPGVKNVGIDNAGTSLMALLIMMVGFRLLTYLSLRRMKI